MARQRDRSRLSVDVRQTAQQAQQAVAGKQEGLVSLLMEQAPPDSQSIGTGTATAVPGDDALSAFEQLHSEDEGQPSLASSPTVLALGAWQQLPDTVDAAVDQAPGRSSAAQSLAASPSGTGSGGGFLIPQCPSGRMLELRISSTWGDNHYVGLAGIELFDRHGQALTLTHPKRQVSAAPHSINVLPEYSSDPRTPDKLLDGTHPASACLPELFCLTTQNATQHTCTAAAEHLHCWTGWEVSARLQLAQKCRPSMQALGKCRHLHDV
jgi:hypothetical protein